jgi:hypothetical protein
MEKGKTALQRAIDLLEEAGFHVDRAYEENYLDAGNEISSTASYSAQNKTGAIILRITPEQE